MTIKTYFFGWGNFKYHFKEVVKTLSSEPSFYSSKRIERLIAFSTMEALTLFFVWHNRNILTAEAFVLCISPLTAFAGFNTIMTAKEVLKTKRDNELNNNANGTSDTSN